MPEILPISQIKRDGGTQSRESLNFETINEYAQAMKEGAVFPPVTVFYDGETYWLADGYHRVNAAVEAGQQVVPCLISQGTRRDAVLHSVGANALHGLRRTDADKNRAVMVMLTDEEWRLWSLNKIAATCGVSVGLVHKLKEKLSFHGEKIKPDQRIVERNGTTYSQNTTNIGKRQRKCPNCGVHDKWFQVGPGYFRCLNCSTDFDREHAPVVNVDPPAPEPPTPPAAQTEEQPAPVVTRYHPGVKARCHKCEVVYGIKDAIYTDWQPTDSPLIWRCPQGHRIADSLMDMHSVNDSYEVPPDLLPEHPVSDELVSDLDHLPESPELSGQTVEAQPESEYSPLEQEPMAKRKPKTNRAGNEYEPQGFDACQTPPYAIDPLLPFLARSWTIWEPACGERLLVDALYDAKFSSVVYSDILTGQNFFEFEPEQWDCIVTNPPYSIKYQWLERCYTLGKPFALLLPVETLGAKSAQTFFRSNELEVIFLDRRINFKMPNIGWEGSAAQFPTAWFTYGLHIGRQMTFAEVTRDE